MMESSSISPDHIWWMTNFFADTATRCDPVLTVVYSEELFAVFSETNSISGMSTSTGRYATASQGEHARLAACGLPQFADVLGADQLRAVARLGGVHRRLDRGAVGAGVEALAAAEVAGAPHVLDAALVVGAGERRRQVLTGRQRLERGVELGRRAGRDADLLALRQDVVEQLDVADRQAEAGVLRAEPDLAHELGVRGDQRLQVRLDHLVEPAVGDAVGDLAVDAVETLPDLRCQRLHGGVTHEEPLPG